jgi:endonuclease/exonuclease/phosphatase family metal-dependent hydrolase/uncharacterized protein (UPF0248 family)
MSKQKPEKQKMATIAEVYNRIIWDTRLNRNLFIAGFHERIADGIREKPLAQWDDNSDIPWHRVRYIRCGEAIVWDRDDRIDLISTDSLPAIAWKLDPQGSSQEDLAALIDNNRAKFKPRAIYRYEGTEWKMCTGAIGSIELDTLTIASYNILSDLHEADKIQTDKRLPAILNELQQTNADIIALQEVTSTAIAAILATDWVKDYYLTEAANANNVKPYGNLIMSRLPFELVEHQFSGHKRVLVGKWRINDRDIHLANIHLTSDRGENALQKRSQQLATVFGYFQQQSGDCLIVGDFNTRVNEQDELVDYANFKDLWKELHPDEAGYTFDPQRNPLAMLMSLESKPARFDRILLRRDLASATHISAIDLFGCEPVRDTNGNIFPSDHFGIRAVLVLEDTKPRSISGSTLARTSQNRSHLTTIRPVYESILAIIPPEDLWPPIQAIRQQYDEPCVTRHLVGLGKYLPKVTQTSALTELVRQLEPELTPTERLQRETVLEIVKQACTDCLGFEASLHLLGSARLGVASSKSDLDVICPTPDYVAGKRFLARVGECLQGLCDRSQVVVDARFPVLRLRVEGISLDLLYTQVEAVGGWERLDLHALAPLIKNTKAIIGCWDADLILDRVTERLPIAAFKLLLTAVRAWAKSRDLYGNSWGFLGGFSWSLLCAYSCINYRGSDFSTESLLTHFFELSSRYDWGEPLALTDAGRAYETQIPRDWLPIVSSIEPCKNTARNVTRSTAKILQSEFVRGATITSQIIAGKSDWQSLYTPSNLEVEFATVLTMTIEHPDRAEREKSLGILEACIIGLVIQLERLDVFVRPSTQVEDCDRTCTVRLYLNLPDRCDVKTIERLTREFIAQSNGLERATSELIHCL